MNKVENSSDPFCRRRGSVYVAVLGTSLIVSVLALSVLALQRIENRMLSASSDVEQAKLNATAAIELGLLEMQQDEDWRTAYNGGSRWFTDRLLNDGTCSLDVIDPIDDDLDDDPVVMIGMGDCGDTHQRIKVKIDPRRILGNDALAEALRNAGPFAENQSDFPFEALFEPFREDEENEDDEEPDEVDEDDEEPDEDVDPTPLDFLQLPTRTPNFARNPSVTNGTNYWISAPPGVPAATNVEQEDYDFHTASLRVERNSPSAGAANSLDVGLLKPATSYQVRIDAHAGYVLVPLILPRTNQFRISLITQYADASFEIYQSTATPVTGGWETISAAVVTPNWSEVPTAVYLLVNSDSPGGTNQTLRLDNIDVYEANARFIYKKVLDTDVNQLYSGAPINSDGRYSIDCMNQKLIIERSRIFGTLAIFNPGPGSSIAAAPNSLSRANLGEPVLLVEGDFSILSGTDPPLSESTNNVDYDLDDEYDDEYDSGIRGLVAVSGDLTHASSPHVVGQLIVGGSVNPIDDSELDIDYQPELLLSPPAGNYRYERRPGSARKAVIEEE